jgi:predicted amidohydrolase YtcJ
MSSGEVLSILNLATVKSIEDLKKIKTNPQNYRDDWLIGFGWDQNLWADPSSINLTELDKIFPNNPVMFIRVDGHAIWVNSVALKRAKITNFEINDPKGGRFERDSNGKITGILIDAARDQIDLVLPVYTQEQIKRFLKEAMEVFHTNGFTHIRDMGGTRDCWNTARLMEDSNDLKLFVEMNFSFDNLKDFKATLDSARHAKKDKSDLLRVAGLKFYFDGALGSEGALLSKPYPNGKKGLELYDLCEIEEILLRTWEYGIPVAIHALGDEAVHKVVRLAYELKNRGSEGILHLEHCEVVRPETIKLMRVLDVRCHLQPSHFLTDKKWLKQKLGDLYQFAFPWETLDESGINYSFGSDSPIEKPNLSLTLKGIEESSSEGIPRPLKSIWSGHSHPDGSWGTDCVTRLFPTGEIQVEFKKD